MDDSNRNEKGRRKYFSDYPFKEVPKKNGKGVKRKRIYSGDYYSYAIPEEYKDAPDMFRNRIKMFYGLITLAMIALWAVGSFIGAASHIENTMYVIVPYVLTAVPLLLMLFTLVEFIFTKNHRYERAFADALTKSLRAKTIFAMICGGLCVAPEIVYIILKASSGNIIDGQITVQSYTLLEITQISIWNDVIYVALFIALTALAFFFLKLQDSLEMKPV